MRGHAYDPDSHVPGRPCTWCGEPHRRRLPGLTAGSRLAAAAWMAARCLPAAARAGWRGDVAWTVALSPQAAARLAVLAAGNPGLCLRDVGDVLAVLADHADQGVYRSGSWERGWLCSAFGHDWTEVMEPDPDGRAPSRQRPRRGPLDAHPDNWGPVPPAPGHWP